MNNMQEVSEALKCILVGKCYNYKYEYTFEHNGETIKTNNCKSNAFGKTTCIYENTRYNNVSYSSRLLEKTETVGIPFIVLLFPFIIGYILKCIAENARTRKRSEEI